jgi:hypothetical protein
VLLLANVAMALEYEAVCALPEHREAAGLSEQEVETFLNAIVAILEPVEATFYGGAICRTPMTR